MLPDDPDAAYLWDIIETSRELAGFIEGKRFVDFESDKMLRMAVERAIEIIGEASRKLSPEFRQAHPEIPWTSIIAQRNVIAHEYGEIKLDRLWRVATERAPNLGKALEPFLPPVPED